MADLLDRIRSELNERMTALRPAADEHARLKRALDALDEMPSSAGAAKPPASSPRARASRAPARATARAKPSPRRRSSPSGSERAAPGQTQQRVIEQLRGAPGSTSTAVAQALGISANAAAATISRLVRQGRVSRLESGGYAPAEPQSPQAESASPPAPARGET